MRRRLSSVSGFLFKVRLGHREDLPTRAIVKFHMMAFGMRSDLHTRQRSRLRVVSVVLNSLPVFFPDG